LPPSAPPNLRTSLPDATHYSLPTLVAGTTEAPGPFARVVSDGLLFESGSVFIVFLWRALRFRRLPSVFIALLATGWAVVSKWDGCPTWVKLFGVLVLTSLLASVFREDSKDGAKATLER
jgi:hypothetical protein